MAPVDRRAPALAALLLLTTDGHPGRRSGAVVLGGAVLFVLVDARARRPGPPAPQA
jgi:hypothetical protein